MREAYTLDETFMLLGLHGNGAREAFIANELQEFTKNMIELELKSMTTAYKEWKKQALYEQALDYASK